MSAPTLTRMTVPRVLTLRRVEALMVQRWPLQEIARLAGVDEREIVPVYSGRANVPRSDLVDYTVHVAVDKTFRRLRLQKGTDDRAREIAVSEGFAPWIAWPEDGGIDDPLARPEMKGIPTQEWRDAIQAHNPQGRREKRPVEDRSSSHRRWRLAPEVRQVVAHLDSLMQSQMGVNEEDIARAAGVHHNVVRNLLNKPQPVVLKSMYPILMSVGPESIVVPDTRVVSVAPLRTLVTQAVSQGWTLRDIDRAAGDFPDALRQTLAGQKGVSLGRYQRIVTACEYLSRKHSRGRGARMERSLMRRRIEALNLRGWSDTEIAKRAGVSRDSVQAMEPQHVTTDIFRKIDAAFVDLIRKPGPSELASDRADALGFAPIEAWPGGTLDDPDVLPDLSRVPESRRDAVRERYGVGAKHAA